MFYSFSAITIKEVQATVQGTGTPSVTINLTHGSDASLTGSTNILSSATAITNTTTGQNITSFGSASIPEDKWIKLITTAKSGTTVTILHVSVKFTKL